MAAFHLEAAAATRGSVWTRRISSTVTLSCSSSGQQQDEPARRKGQPTLTIAGPVCRQVRRHEREQVLVRGDESCQPQFHCRWRRLQQSRRVRGIPTVGFRCQFCLSQSYAGPEAGGFALHTAPRIHDENCLRRSARPGEGASLAGEGCLDTVLATQTSKGTTSNAQGPAGIGIAVIDTRCARSNQRGLFASCSFLTIFLVRAELRRPP
jgi:hypothetical protein